MVDRYILYYKCSWNPKSDFSYISTPFLTNWYTTCFMIPGSWDWYEKEIERLDYFLDYKEDTEESWKSFGFDIYAK